MSIHVSLYHQTRYSYDRPDRTFGRTWSGCGPRRIAARRS